MAKKQSYRKAPSRQSTTTNNQNSTADYRNSQMDNGSIAFNTENPTSRSFRFLNLPQELRNEIYEYDLLNCARIRLVKKGRLVSSSNLHLVCRQLDNELGALLRSTARVSRGKLYYPVKDFEFKRAVIAVLQWLVENTSVQSIIIQLSISKSWSSFPTLDSLPKWYKWIDANSKHDNVLDIKYAIGSVQDAARAESFLSSLVQSEPSRQPPHALLHMIWSFLTWYSDNVYEQTYFTTGAYTFDEKILGIKQDIEAAGIDLGPDAPPETPEQVAERELAEMKRDAEEAIGIAQAHFGWDA